MRITDSWTGGHGPDRLGGLVHAAGSLPEVFRGRCQQLQEIQQWLGGYFQAAAIMLQLPGAGEYEFVGYEGELCDLVKATQQNELLNVLGTCLDKLGVKELMSQVPAPDYHTEELSEEWTAWLDKEQDVKNGLLNVVAECLDALVIRPGNAEIEKANELSWWQRWVPDREY